MGGKNDTFSLFIKQVLHQENYEIKSLVHLGFVYSPVVICLFKVIRTMCEICSKLTTKTSDVFSSVSVVEFEQVNDLQSVKKVFKNDMTLENDIYLFPTFLITKIV